MTTATQSGITPAYQVGDHIHVHRKGTATPGRISSIHCTDDGVEYVVRTDAGDGGMGQVLNIWTTSGQSSFLSRASHGGETR